MKKIVITLVVVGSALGVKAQQGQDLLKQQLLKTDSLGIKPLNKINLPVNRNVDNMPIANMPGNSKMPVVQTDVTAYNMPVAGSKLDTKARGEVPNTPFLNGQPPLYYNIKPYPNTAPPTNNNK